MFNFRNRVFRSSKMPDHVVTDTRAGYMREIVVIFLGHFMAFQKCTNVWQSGFSQK